MKVRDAIKMLESDGWFLVKQKGSHMQFKHKIERLDMLDEKLGENEERILSLIIENRKRMTTSAMTI